MHPNQIAEFSQLFQEFKTSFVDTPAGETHIKSYNQFRESGRKNFETLQWLFTNKNIVRSADLTDELTSQILQTLLPHSNSANHQEQCVWIHIAPAIAGDVQTWYNASGFNGDWKEVAYTIFDLIRSCIQNPDRLDSLCQHFSSLACTKGFQSGMLTPILNALKPDLFLLVNSKSSRTIGYFTNSKCSPKLEDYPAVNRQGHQLIRELAPIMNQIWNVSIDR